MSKKVIDVERVEQFLQEIESHIGAVRGYIKAEETTIKDPDPIEEEEPEPEKPDVPLSNFEAIILDKHNIQCRWEGHVDGEIDIEFSVPSQDKDKKGKAIPWKHSVIAYTKQPVQILNQSYIIWVYDTNVPALFRAKKARWKILGFEFGVWTSPPATAKYPEPIKEPVKPDPKPEEEPKPDPIEDEEPAPETKDPDTVVEMAFVFLAGEEFDVWLNGMKLLDGFSYTFHNVSNNKMAGVKIVQLSEIFKTLVIDESRTEQAIKVVNRDPENDLYKINSNHTHDPDPEFWGTPAQKEHPLGVIYSRHGNTTQKEGEEIPDPEFWKGWAEDSNKPDHRVFHPQWSKTGKIVISFLS